MRESVLPQAAVISSMGRRMEVVSALMTAQQAETHNEEEPVMTIKEAQMELREHGMTLRKDPFGGQYRVNFKGGKEATAYYTDDRDDAVLSGISMARARANKEAK